MPTCSWVHMDRHGLLEKLSKPSRRESFIDATTFPKHVDTYEKHFQDELPSRA